MERRDEKKVDKVKMFFSAIHKLYAKVQIPGLILSNQAIDEPSLRGQLKNREPSVQENRLRLYQWLSEYPAITHTQYPAGMNQSQK